jgi:histidinol-phosphate/aromatic aminotransferase/cobyric acid decarboxylase-like protein
MRRFREYYRQFEAMTPEEASLELRARREEEKRHALSPVRRLDLSGTAWHEPPHPEAVNAATFALRRALHAYPAADGDPVRAALAARYGVAAERAVLGHGAGELLRAACAALLRDGGDALVAWPGWHPLPALVEAGGGRPVPVALAADGAPDASSLADAAAAPGVRAVLLCAPNDPTGAALSRAALAELCARVPARVTVVLDAALAEFGADADDPAPLAAALPNLLVVRSFSKAHALAGLRAGAALGPPELVARLAPSGGLGAPAQAALAWAAGDGGAAAAARRRAEAAAARRQLSAELAGSPVSVTPGVAPFAWLSSASEDGATLAARLAARGILVAPGRVWGDERHVRAGLRGPEAVERLAAALVG